MAQSRFGCHSAEDESAEDDRRARFPLHCNSADLLIDWRVKRDSGSRGTSLYRSGDVNVPTPRRASRVESCVESTF